ncbi:hypothetical protein JQK88_07370 [Mesorhizobium caraganae]|uniref:hypothetical protein n=1 Tax=Mesorhizobium caraganae TaxID=483206 RepID=UPI001939D76A|nr:hypothetical protein [Mesorhizobium caraganae]MBM2711070.1 hypothetical protein [Mesorhizobium caraganae]
MDRNMFRIDIITDPDTLLDWVVEQAINAAPLIDTSGSIQALLESEIAHLHKVGFLPPPADSGEYLRDALAAMARPAGSFLCNERLPTLLAEFMHRLLANEEPIELHEAVLRLADIARLNLTASDDVSSDGVLIQARVALSATHHMLIGTRLERRMRRQGRGSNIDEARR